MARVQELEVVMADAKFWEEYFATQTPAPGNKCKTEGCGGTVVRKCIGWSSRGGYQYSLPSCDRCKRAYFYAKDARRVGARAVAERMSLPFANA